MDIKEDSSLEEIIDKKSLNVKKGKRNIKRVKEKGNESILSVKPEEFSESFVNRELPELINDNIETFYSAGEDLFEPSTLNEDSKNDKGNSILVNSEFNDDRLILAGFSGSNDSDLHNRNSKNDNGECILPNPEIDDDSLIPASSSETIVSKTNEDKVSVDSSKEFDDWDFTEEFDNLSFTEKGDSAIVDLFGPTILKGMPDDYLSNSNDQDLSALAKITKNSTKLEDNKKPKKRNSRNFRIGI